ncbi:GIY-YIG nuclease family protein [Macrococcus capreoli]
MKRYSLDDIFSDPRFEEMIGDIPKNKKKYTDPEVEKFLEIIKWIDSHEGKEPQKTRDMIERRLYSRLRGFRNREEIHDKLKKFDKYNLLKKINDKKILKETVKSLDDILNDDTLFEKEEMLSDLLDLSRYKRTIQAAEKNSVRRRASHFEQYEPLFKLVQKEIASGIRKVVYMDSEKNITQGKFYIDNGILLYIKNVGEFFIDKNGYRNARLHVIYENGTENKNLLLRSLASNLFDRTRNGRMVTEVMSDVFGETTIEERSRKSISTGYIYVAKSLSKNPLILKYNNLYKIGYSKNDVEKRVANAENEATYLYAPVTIIAKWEVQNFSAKKLETIIHHEFNYAQLEVSIPTAHGKINNPEEWYIISFNEIEDKINKIIMKLNI